MSGPAQGRLHADLGNVLTRVLTLGGSDPEDRIEQVTPTALDARPGSAEAGFEAVLGAARRHCPGAEPGIALVHLHGLPRAAVFGLAGLPTTELSRQAALRRAGSAIIQVRSTDPASLEQQLIDVRAQPLDFIIFTVATRQAAERLMSAGGPRARVLSSLPALYNGPAAEYGPLSEVVAGSVDLRQLPSTRSEANEVDIGPTEAALDSLVAEVLSADPGLQAVRREGFHPVTFAAAFTAAAGSLGRLWAEESPGAAAAGGGRGGALACIELGGRYTEFAIVAADQTVRYVDDFAGDVSRLALGETPPGAGGGSRVAGALDTEALGQWLPIATPLGETNDALANYLRRPYAFPSNWAQLMLLMGLGRLRLQRARFESHSLLSGDWRVMAQALVAGGGWFRYLPGPALALALVLDGVQPLGVTEIYCDRAGSVPLSAAAGTLHSWPDERWVPRLATVIAPRNLKLDWRRPHEDDLLALVTVERKDSPGVTFRIVPGSLIRFPLRNGERATVNVHPVRDHDFGSGSGKPWRGEVVGGRCGLVFDARGRPVSLPPDPEVRRSKLLEWLNTLDPSLTWGDVR
jgi:hypothetical protein